ncbi:MAG: hypothetical protein ACP5OV_08255 [Acidimicrobiales bacterium]
MAAAILTVGVRPVLAAAAPSVPGSGTIATASVITLNTPEFGNSALGPDAPPNTGPVMNGQYWLVPLTAGDRVQIVVTLLFSSSNFAVGVWPPGTTDETISSTSTVVNGGVNTTFTAPVSGTYVVLIGSQLGYQDGPFSFAVTALHQAFAYLPPSLTTAPRGHVVVLVRYLDGTPVSVPALRLSLIGVWKDASYVPASRHTLGVDSVVRGRATFTFSLPPRLRGSTIRIFAQGEAVGWVAVHSRAAVVHVT